MGFVEEYGAKIGGGWNASLQNKQRIRHFANKINKTLVILSTCGGRLDNFCDFL